jgi:hypothetical protein
VIAVIEDGDLRGSRYLVLRQIDILTLKIEFRGSESKLER